MRGVRPDVYTHQMVECCTCSRAFIQSHCRFLSGDEWCTADNTESVLA